VKVLILGIGNTIMGDDGVGIHVVRELAKKIHNKKIEIREATMDSLNLLEFVPHHDRLIVIDAIMVHDKKIGEIYRLKPENFDALKAPSLLPHQFNLITTLDIGNKIFPSEMPRDVTVFAIGAHEVTEITEELSPEIEKAIPQVVNMILEEL